MLITETGAGLADAESLCSVEEADRYHLARGNDATWNGLAIGIKEQRLRKATDFMRAVYRARWAGSRVSQAQALDWPRTGVVVDGFTIASNAVPADVVKACAELALRASAELLADADTASSVVKKEVIGPIETEFFEPQVDPVARFVGVDALLAPYFGTAGSGSGSIRLVRA